MNELKAHNMTGLKNHILKLLNKVGDYNIESDRYLIAKCVGVIDSMCILGYIDDFTHTTLSNVCMSILKNESVSSNTQILIQFCK